MIQKVDKFESIRITGVKIDTESLINILEATGESLITLECDETVYESLGEIKSNKSAICIPFEINCGETKIDFTSFEVRIFGRSSSSHRQIALARELRRFVPVLSRYPFVTYIIAMQLVALGVPRIFDLFSFDFSNKVFGLDVQDIGMIFLIGLSFIFFSILYGFYWTRVKIYYSKGGFWMRNADKLIVGIILMLVTGLFSYFVDILLQY